MLKYARAHDSSTESSILFGGGKVSAFNAALVNGTYILSTNMGEGFTRCMVHPASSLLPALLAVAQRERSSGRDLLAAAALAYDFLIRLGMTMRPSFVLEQGLFQPSVLGTFASAAAVARLRGFGPDKIAHALGIAACHTPSSIMKGGRASIADSFEGYAAALGVMSADMVAAGVTGPKTWVEPWYTAIVRDHDLTQLNDRLGTYWYTSSGGLRVKTRPVMAMAGPVIEAVSQFLRSGNIDHREIAEVVVESSARIELNRIYRPTTIGQARQSIPLLVAASFVYADRFRADPYFTRFVSEDLLTDSEVAQFGDKVKLVTDPVMDYNLEHAQPKEDGSGYIKLEARVTLRFRDGTERSEYADLFALGTGNMSRELMADKFRAVTKENLPTATAEKVIETVWGLDGLADVSDLVALVES
jgi:2-methylcitrate dehydratase PrpD